MDGRLFCVVNKISDPRQAPDRPPADLRHTPNRPPTGPERSLDEPCGKFVSVTENRPKEPTAHRAVGPVRKRSVSQGVPKTGKGDRVRRTDAPA